MIVNKESARRYFSHIGLKMCGVVICIVIGSLVCGASNIVARTEKDIFVNAKTNNCAFITASNESIGIESRSDINTNNVSITSDNLLSGLIGALIVAILNWIVEFFRRKRECYSLLKAVKSECEFNLSIMDEIAEGIAQGTTGSYKRVKNDFFLELRKISYKYHFHEEFYSCMARVSCDEDVLNSELDALQISSKDGDINNILLRRTALCAVVGVKGSLSSLKAKVDILVSRLPWSLFF